MKQSNKNNIYLPFAAEIEGIRDMGADVKHFSVVSDSIKQYIPGQFFMVGRWGAGEVPISVTSVWGDRKKAIEFAIRKVGSVTNVLHSLNKGDVIWLRGPYGNGFDTVQSRGQDVIFAAGGIGIIPLRPLINDVLSQKRHYRKLFLLYGSKSPLELLFLQDIELWRQKGIEVILTVDEKNKKWKGNVGVVTEHVDKIKSDFEKACAYICGPEVMIKKTMEALSLKGVRDSHIITTFEARMKCGVGKCGQCYHGTEYICINGPVFSYEEIKKRKIYGP